MLRDTMVKHICMTDAIGIVTGMNHQIFFVVYGCGMDRILGVVDDYTYLNLFSASLGSVIAHAALCS